MVKFSAHYQACRNSARRGLIQNTPYTLTLFNLEQIWHSNSSCTNAQAESLDIQCHSHRIIDSSISYDIALSLTQFASLHDCREHLNKKIFTSITTGIPSSCISRLLPPPRNSSITSRLCTPSLYPRPTTRTKRYTSFTHHAVLNYQ